jgi:hypothetical protein
MYIEIIIILAASAVTWYIIRHINEERARIKKLMVQHGLEEAPEYADELGEKLKNTSLRRYKKLHVYNLYRYRSLDFIFYRFKVDRGGSDSPDPLFYAVESSEFNLPHFSIFPYVKLPGLLGKLWERLVGNIKTTPGVSRVRIENAPEFNSRYLLYGRGDIAINQKIPLSTWERLAAIPNYLILDVLENTIFFQLIPWKPSGKPEHIREGTREEILITLELAGKINAAFKYRRSAGATV